MNSRLKSYEYSAFGEPTVSSGELASSFTHQFSTKPYCEVTGFFEFVYRKYLPSNGIWTKRDPFFEMEINSELGDVARQDDLGTMTDFYTTKQRHGNNVYLFDNNNSVNYIDYNGLNAISIGMPIAGICSAVDGLAPFGDVIGVAVIGCCAIIDYARAQGCYPCSPPVGTIAYKVDLVPPSKPHWPHKGNHTHHLKMNQSPWPMCKCFWERDYVRPTEGISPLPGEIPLPPGSAGGGGAF